MKMKDTVVVIDPDLIAFGREGIVKSVDHNIVKVLFNLGSVTVPIDFIITQLALVKSYVAEFEDGWQNKKYEDMTENEKIEIGRMFNGSSGRF